MTKLTTTIKREIHIHEVESPLAISLDQEGIQICVPGFKNKLNVSWNTIVRAAQTPSNCLSYLEGAPLNFLQHQASTKKAKEDKKNKL